MCRRGAFRIKIKHAQYQHTIQNIPHSSKIDNINSEFERRFSNLSRFQTIFEFISFPCGEYNIEDMSSNVAHIFQLNLSDVESEVLTIKSDKILKSRANEFFFNFLA